MEKDDGPWSAGKSGHCHRRLGPGPPNENVRDGTEEAADHVRAASSCLVPGGIDGSEARGWG